MPEVLFNQGDFDQWISQQGLFRCFLVECDYLDNGEINTLYLANAPFQSKGSDSPAHEPYDDVLYSDLQINESMDEFFFGRTITRRSSIKFLSTFFVDNLIDKLFTGQQVRIYLGDKSWPKVSFKKIASWIAGSLEPDSQDFELPIRDASAPLDVAVCSKYTTGIAKGEVIPRCFGEVFNAEPVLISDFANGVYQANDGALTSLTVKDSGLAIAATIDLALGTFALNSAPQGRITFDAVANLNTCQDITSDMLAASNLTAVADTFGILPNYSLGGYINDARTRRDVIDICFISCGAAWKINNDNQLESILFNGLSNYGEKLLTVDDIEDLRVKRRILPAPLVTVNYAKNNTVQKDGLVGAAYSNVALRTVLSKEWVPALAQNSQVALDFPENPSITINTWLTNELDAQKLADNKALLADKLHLVWEMDVYGIALDFAIGEEIDTEFIPDLAGTAIVLKNDKNFTDGQATLEVWQ